MARNLIRRQKLDVMEPIGPFIESLNLGLVIEVAEEADGRAKSWLSKSGRKMGTGFPAFDMFVVALLVASERAAGRPGRGRLPAPRFFWVAETTPAEPAGAVEAGAARAVYIDVPDGDQRSCQRSLMPE